MKFQYSRIRLGFKYSWKHTARNKKGIKDFSANTLSKDINDYEKYRGITLTAKTDLENHKKAEDLEAIMENAYDTKPDIFNFNLPTISEHLFYKTIMQDHLYLKKDGLKGFTIPNEDVIIDIDKSGFHIKDSKGIEYWMGSKSQFQSYYNYKISQNSTSYAIDNIKINDKFISFVYAKKMYTRSKIQLK